MNQADFAREVGKSMQSLQNYERGAKPPAEVVGKLYEIATAHHRIDLALALGGDWKVRRVFEPGERIISARPEASKAPVENWHQMLDEILNSGQADAADAVKSSLTVSRELVRQRARKVYSKPEKKRP